jgi:ABC-type multidrug transport system fused ATPase/permease subunit
MIEIKRGKWGSKSFKSTELFQKWLETERDFYQPLISGMPNAAQQFQYFQHAINSLISAVSQPENSHSYVTQAGSYAESIYSGSGWTLPPSDSSDGKLIKSFAHSPTLMARVAHQLGATTPVVNEDNLAALIVAAYNYPKLIGADGFSFAEAPANTLRDLESQINKATTLLEEVRQGQAALFENMHQESLRQIHEAEIAANGQRDDTRKEWSTLKNTYDTQLALQAPRTYWAKQRDEHKLAAATRQNWFIVASVVSLFVVAIFIYVMWNTFSAKNVGDVPLAMWVITGAVLGVSFWVIRLFSRLYLSREHLLRDAEERVTMIETFLALMQHEHLKGDDLKFVLAAIFRPTEDGLVKDDGLPTPLVELFQAAKVK